MAPSTPQPYRSAKIKDLCVDCGELAVGACACCGRPLCSAHVPARRRWCPACETELEQAIREAEQRGERVSAIAGMFYPFIIFTFGAAFAVGFGLGHLLGLSQTISALVGLIFMPASVVGAGTWYAKAIHPRRIRRKFLKSRTPARQLTQGE